ncbi:BPSL0761 family protein [Arenimonas sp.]|uniref:BPSL0761 family protein n=1 Tax=Arenimonas sp. TaxID=1872635 RepID=UPI0035B4BFEA
MSTPEERLRALVWAGGLLVELAKDDSLPRSLRRRAVVIARHFPTIEELAGAARANKVFGGGLNLESPDKIPEWSESLTSGPLQNSTRLAIPE